ncbi:MAG TPA: LmeA family phospholipid-binding protein [Fimbriimonas sp.]|nr:LmeA family phospholipid-binding protein [Fimbriimonas sp.]
MTATLKGFVLPMGLTIDTVNVSGSGIHLESDPFEVRLSQPGNFEARLKASDIAGFLNEKAPGGLKNFKIEARDDKLYVDMVKTVLLDVPVKAVCKLRIEARRQVFIDLESVEVSGVGAKNLVQSQLDKLNPVVDAADFPVDAALLSVTTASNEVVLQGTISPKR